MEFTRPKKLNLALDIAPLIDVVFLLLIFFMLSSSFLMPSLNLTLPKAVMTDAREPEALIVSIQKDGSLFVNTEKVTMASLPQALSAALLQEEQKSVHLRGDAEMPYKLFVQVMDIARQCGAMQINILHEGDE